MAGLTADARGIIVQCAQCGQRNRLAPARLGDQVRCARCKTALPPPAAPVDVPDASAFETLVSTARVPVLVDFWAPWCGPCRIVAPELEKVAARQTGRLIVAKVDTELAPDVAARFGIQSIPTMGLFARGREIGRRIGAMGAGDIEAFVRDASAS